MAVQSTHVNSGLSMKYKDGIDAQGRDINRIKKFSNVKLTAVDQNIYDVTAAFSPLLKYPISEIIRVDEHLIINL